MKLSKVSSALQHRPDGDRGRIQGRSPTNGMGGSRALCAMSIFAFVTFAAVDPFMVEGSIRPLFHIRLIAVAGSGLLLASNWTTLGSRHPTLIGCLVSIWTGVCVVILTQMTGGADSAYWPMVMLTFFTVALMVPMKPLQAMLTFGLTAGFFDFWHIFKGATGTQAAWTASNAGIWLSLVVSVVAVDFLSRLRRREDDDRRQMFSLNEQLRLESLERLRTLEALQRSRQLDAVGQLAAGMAHELNNVLMVIHGSAEAIKRDPVAPGDDAERIIASASRGARLTSDILLFAREGAREDKPFWMQEIVRGVGEIIERSHRGRVQVEVWGGDEACWVSGDAQLMSQVLMNLCLNGIDSMEGAGKLTMRVGIDASDARHAAGAAVRVEIEDQGEGMTPDVLAQAFDPFFTTKPAGEGTGLGLSMAYGTVEDHGGRIELESTPGAGTRGIITLPRLPTPAPVQVKDEREQQASHLMGKTILVVDDDDMVRPVMAELLESLGLRTHTADGGASALAIFEATAGPIDLVLLDMNMVGMDGAETFRRLREFQSDLPVLIYSGFAQNAVVSKMLEDRRCQFLRKPFSIKTLGGAVSNLLETPG